MTILIVVLCVLLAVAAYRILILPWARRRGTTPAERKQKYFGDTLVKQPGGWFTQAVTINVPPEKVWPWLVQIGYRRAGWYTYDFIYRLIRAADFTDGSHSAKRIIPELQKLQPGDEIKLAPVIGYRVLALEPDRLMLLHSAANLETNQSYDIHGPKPAKYVNTSWLFQLEETADKCTRFIVRYRIEHNSGLLSALMFSIPTELGGLVMNPKFMRGIRQRAEALANGKTRGN